MSSLHHHIEVNSAVMMGKPVIRGTRITVASIVAELGAGYTFPEVLAAHPNLKKEDILAALQYAAALLQNERIIITAQ
jgi:uncharacterized protein (DUF433 family)